MHLSMDDTMREYLDLHVAQYPVARHDHCVTDRVVQTVATGVQPRCVGNARRDIIRSNGQQPCIGGLAFPLSQPKRQPAVAAVSDCTVAVKMTPGDPDFEPGVEADAITAPRSDFLSCVGRNHFWRSDPLILPLFVACT